MAQAARPRVLVVEDDATMRIEVRAALEPEGFDVVDVAGSGAIDAVATSAPDAVILDLGTFGDTGLDVLAAIRRAHQLPILVLSEQTDEADRVVALERGADDYVVSPFLPRELAARVRVLLRRVAPGTADVLTFSGLVIDRTAREVTVAGVVVPFTAKEFDLLVHLASVPRNVVSREELLRAVWASSSEFQDSDTVTEHIRRVRHKIEVDPRQPKRIMTVRGVGYRFEPGNDASDD
jgi:DNA-binding response OmpR family regulator